MAGQSAVDMIVFFNACAFIVRSTSNHNHPVDLRLINPLLLHIDNSNHHVEVFKYQLQAMGYVHNGPNPGQGYEKNH